MRARYLCYKAFDEGADNPWIDMPEMEPKGRAKLRQNATVPESYVVINDDGTVSFDDSQVEIEVYPETIPPAPEVTETQEATNRE